MSGVSLTGKNRINQNNLSGKSFFGENASFEVKKIKTTIFNNIILPLISKQWRKLEENLFTLDKINKKLDMYLYENNSINYDNSPIHHIERLFGIIRT